MYLKLIEQFFAQEKYPKLFEQTYNRKGYKILYHISSIEEIGLSDFFYKNLIIPKETFRDVGLDRIRGPKMFFLTQNKDFALDFQKFRSKIAYLYTFELKKSLNLFNFSCKTDIELLQKNYPRVWNLYISLLREKKLNDHRRAWFLSEEGNITQAIKDLNYDGIEQEGFLPNKNNFHDSENIAIFDMSLIEEVNHIKIDIEKEEYSDISLLKYISQEICKIGKTKNIESVLKLVKSRLSRKYQLSLQEIDRIFIEYIIPIFEISQKNNFSLKYSDIKEMLDEKGLIKALFDKEKYKIILETLND
jgi:hypothetical protein